MRSIKFIPLLFALILISACKKETVPETPLPESMHNGILVLNEGLFQLNNSSLSWIDLSTGTTNSDFFTQKTGRLLGDTGNDLKRYGGKIYIVVNVSSTIEVLNATNGSSIKQISMLNGSVSKQPRSIAFYGSKAFIACFDGFVDVLDTTSLEIVQRIPVGKNPDGICVSGQKIFVSNSGGLNTPEMDSTVSVIDALSLTELNKIVVGKNPGPIVTDYAGDVYVIARGNYSNIPSRMRRINPVTCLVENYFSFEASGIEAMENKLLISSYNSSTQQNEIALFDAATELIETANFVDLSQVHTLYNMIYRSADQQLYILDAMGYTNSGYLRIYNKTGTYQKSYATGLNPNSVIFYP